MGLYTLAVAVEALITLVLRKVLAVQAVVELAVLVGLIMVLMVQ